MRLLIVSHSYVLASARSKARELGKRFELTLLVPNHWRFDLLDARAEPDAGAPFELVTSSVLWAGYNIRYLYAIGSVLRTMRRVRPRIVLVEEEPTSLALTQFSLLRKPFGYRLFFFTWENIPWHPHFTRGIEWINLQAAAGAIAGNQEAAEVLKHKGFRQPVAVIPQMGIDPTLFHPSDTLRPRMPFVIGYVGRIAAEKGLETLFEAASHLPGEWELVLIGAGPLRGALQRVADAAGWARRLRWLEFVPREHLPGQYRQMHTLVLPSQTTPRWKEQFGRVIIEAMACGVPVIGSDSGAIPEVIGDAGLIFPERDADALRRSLVNLMQDTVLREELSARAVQRARMHFSDQAVARSLRQFLASFA
jgi:glycosyltransferase involved in cell wall biosynthesis